MAPTESQIRVLRTLRDGSQQAQEVADSLSIDTSAAYRHLEGLLQRGLVAAEKKAIGRGRPKKHYHLTEDGWETFPRDYSFLLSALLAQVTRKNGREAVLEHLDDIALELGGSIAKEVDPQARMRKLVALYNKLGFEARVERKKDRVFLVQRNCPLLKIARDDPEALCACLDEGIIRAALPGSEVTLHATQAQGDARCRHEIKEKVKGRGRAGLV